MKKNEILEALNAKGYPTKKRDGYADTHYHIKKVGRFNVYIYLSNGFKVIIETAGMNNYFINLHQVQMPFTTKLDEVIKHFENFVELCQNFEDGIKTLKDEQ